LKTTPSGGRPPNRWRAIRTAGLTGAAVMLVLLSACSTTEGFGTDVKKLGNSIENSAERNK
jgi:predicted small secreted protein